ncbi:epithelial membrane protein 2-like [Hydractinia symbiolongicarpus]|uniref:epithelial membrane protein 2-like n=1 Tax=Hydractinia symbiolongicarpus TaxID=13093 RepID=UPI00254CCEAF|nr:epithelial membrane protein 2-like [Hydractinia symbiolongicarpus]
MEQSNFRVLILLLTIGSIISIILSISGNHWIKVTNYTAGLWKKCEHGKECIDLEQFWLPAVRVVMVTGLGLLCSAVLYYAAMVFKPRSFGSLCMSVFLGLASACVLIGLSVYLYFDMDTFTNSFQYHWSFFMGWLSFVLALIATTMSCYDARKNVKPFENAVRLE